MKASLLKSSDAKAQEETTAKIDVEAGVGLASLLVSNVKKRLVSLKGDPKSVSLLSDETILSDVKEFIPTGFHELDRALGGGFAVGRASEVFGAEGAGKSALVHRLIRSVQDAGGTVVHIDSEVSLDPSKMKQLGIDPRRLVYVTPKTIEETWDVIWDVIATLRKKPPKAPTLISWDSIAGSVPRAELEEKSANDSHIGLIARALSRGCRKMFRAIAEVRAHMLWVNQERSAIGGGPFQEAETVGGKAVKYAASQRLRVTRVQTMKQGERATGYRVRCVTKKNRLAPPHQRANWILDFKVGPSPELTLLEFLLEEKQIRKTPAGLTMRYLKDAEPFKRRDWLGLMAKGSIRRATEKAAVAILDARAAKIADDAAEAEEDTEEGD